MIDKNWRQTQKEEAATWLIKDPVLRREKMMRETIRYPLLAKQMGLTYLDTSWMEIFDVGGGPFGGVSSILPCKASYVIDPLVSEYKKYFSCYNYSTKKAEDLKADFNSADLVIVTNALDHFEDPELFLKNMIDNTRPSTYFAHFHAIDNAISHPHKAHVHNINPKMINYWLNKDFECVWYMDFERDGLTYGWRKQPAFSGLYRKVTGY